MMIYGLDWGFVPEAMHKKYHCLDNTCPFKVVVCWWPMRGISLYACRQHMFRMHK